MEQNFYMTNMQKLLHIVKELHQRGYEKLRVVPHLSASGVYWRCLFIYSKERGNESLPVSSWLHNTYPYLQEKEIPESISELTTNFLRQHPRFMENCLGMNCEYVRWFDNMLSNLEHEELPYAFADYFTGIDFWRTSRGKEIPTLPDEFDYIRQHY